MLWFEVLQRIIVYKNVNETSPSKSTQFKYNNTQIHHKTLNLCLQRTLKTIYH